MIVKSVKVRHYIYQRNPKVLVLGAKTVFITNDGQC